MDNGDGEGSGMRGCYLRSTRIEDGSVQDGVDPVNELAYVKDYHMTT